MRLEDLADRWVVYAESYEQWVEEVTVDSVTTTTPYAEWAAVQEQCRNSHNSVQDDENDPTGEEFYDRARLLYLDAWVSCQ